MGSANLFADTGSCSYPEYSQCGTPIENGSNQYVFKLAPGLGFPTIVVDWYNHYANFTDSIYVHDLTTGFIGPMSYSNQGGQQAGTPDQLIPSLSNVHYGDSIQLVLHVANDPNHPGGIDYADSCTGLSNICLQDKDLQNNAISHVFAETVSNCENQQANPCIFMGFKDLPFAENGNHNFGNDWDYNDFEVWVYGLSCTNCVQGQFSNEVPEPSSMILLAGFPLAFAIGRLRSLL
jgi:hypothetical protein